jgi:hypothetical protein
MDMQSIVIGPLSVLCILGLVFGTASALVITATETGGMAGDGQRQPRSPEAIISHLEEKGVDVTEAEAELARGETSAVQVWLDTYFHAHEGEMPYQHSCSEPQTEIPSGTSSERNE